MLVFLSRSMTRYFTNVSNLHEATYVLSLQALVKTQHLLKNRFQLKRIFFQKMLATVECYRYWLSTLKVDGTLRIFSIIPQFDSVVDQDFM